MRKLHYVVFDDAYQNHQVYKDCQILLLDARQPFGNGHCLPAGPLREKDCSRADLILLTHSDAVMPEKLKSIESYIHRNYGMIPLFYGQHVVRGLFRYGSHFTPLDELKGVPLGLVSGIADNEKVIESMRRVGLVPLVSHYYNDHHTYTPDDIEICLVMLEKHALKGIVTTRKDWYKFLALLNKMQTREQIVFYVLDIDFAFLRPEHETLFFEKIEERTGLVRDGK